MQCKALVRCLVPGKSSINICYYLYWSIPGVIGVLEEGTPNCHLPNPQAQSCTKEANGKILCRRRPRGGASRKGLLQAPDRPLCPGALPSPGLSLTAGRGPAGGATLPSVVGRQSRGSAEAVVLRAALWVGAETERPEQLAPRWPGEGRAS